MQPHACAAAAPRAQPASQAKSLPRCGTISATVTCPIWPTTLATCSVYAHLFIMDTWRESNVASFAFSGSICIASSVSYLCKQPAGIGISTTKTHSYISHRSVQAVRRVMARRGSGHSVPPTQAYAKCMARRKARRAAGTNERRCSIASAGHTAAESRTRSVYAAQRSASGRVPSGPRVTLRRERLRVAV